MNERTTVCISLNSAHTFSLLQHRVSAYTPPHSTLYRYCTTNVEVGQDLGFTFQCYFLLSIWIQHYFLEKLYDQFQKKNPCYLSLTHNIKICTYIDISFVIQHLKFSKTCFFDISQYSLKNRRSFV